MVAIFLLLGAVVNVAVAWGGLWTISGSQWQALPLDEQERLWSQFAQPGWPSCDGLGRRWIGAIATADVAFGETNSRNTSYAVGRYRRGWPFRTLQGYQLWTPSGKSQVKGVEFHTRGSDGTFRFFFVPLQPLWGGFAINTVFYAALLWPLIWGPFALRKHIRRKRGLCVVCGYDLRGNLPAGCPECGWRRETDSSRALP